MERFSFQHPETGILCTVTVEDLENGRFDIHVDIDPDVDEFELDPDAIALTDEWCERYSFEFARYSTWYDNMVRQGVSRHDLYPVSDFESDIRYHVK